MKKTFSGFGFGPIQSGLFLREARLSGNFARTVVSEIDPQLVGAVRANGGRCTINVAHRDGVEQFVLEGVEIFNPIVAADRARLVEAIAASDEMATALPSVGVYGQGGAASVVALLADGLAARRPAARPAVLYAAENDNRAAEILSGELARHSGRPPAGFQALNTVIGKMSGVIADRAIIDRLGLATLVPAYQRAVLVEEFNRILVSAISLPDFRRGITAFEEKKDLLPFEEAKLYGHNAIHALIAYLADLEGLRTIADAGRNAGIMAAARAAFIGESGAAMIARHAGTDDGLFTRGGYRRYAEDLLERMTCPHLHDLVERVGRDPLRKLGYDDRLFGTMRFALDAGVEPVNLARGAAACLLFALKRRDWLPPDCPQLPASASALTPQATGRWLTALWGKDTDKHADSLIRLTQQALVRLGG